MNIRTTLTALTLGLGSLTAVAPAFAQGRVFDHAPPTGAPMMAPPPVATPVFVRPPSGMIAPPAFVASRQAAVFTAQSQMRIEQIAQHLRIEVARGTVRPQALFALRVERSQAESALRRATFDGFVTRPEQARIGWMIDGLARLDDQYRVPAYGHHGHWIGYR